MKRFMQCLVAAAIVMVFVCGCPSKEIDTADIDSGARAVATEQIVKPRSLPLISQQLQHEQNVALLRIAIALEKIADNSAPENPEIASGSEGGT